jgi:hypothetical protein
MDALESYHKWLGRAKRDDAIRFRKRGFDEV